MSTTVQEFDFSVDLLQSLLWQYNTADTLTALLQSKQDWYNINQTEFWQNWIRDVFDLRTANEFGMQVWARILNIPLYITLPPSPTSKPTWGFGSFNKNFAHGNFSSRGRSSAGLTLEEQRLVLRLRYWQLVVRPTVPQINRILKQVFGDLGSVYVLDSLDMSQTYVFTFVPGAQLLFILESYDLLPRPSAVGNDYINTARLTFGFGAFKKNFTNGNYRV